MAESDAKFALQTKYDQLVESHKRLVDHSKSTDLSYEQLQAHYKAKEAHKQICTQAYNHCIQERIRLGNRVSELESQLESKRRKVSMSPSKCMSPDY